MKKILFLILTLCLITGCGCEKEENNDPVSVDYNDYIQSDTTLAHVDEKEITLNGNKHKVALIYSYKKTDEIDGEYEYVAYSYYLTMLYDNKTTDIQNLYIYSEDSSYNSLMTTDFGEKFVKMVTMKDTKTNEEYLSVSIEYYHTSGVDHSSYYASILNENGEKIYGYNSDGCYGIYYASNENMIPYIEQNSNYLLVLYASMKDTGNVGYREKITIENSKYKSETIKFTEKIDYIGGC